MLYLLHHLADPNEWTSVLRMFEFITVRTFAGAGTAFLLSVLLGAPVIRGLRRLKIGQYVRQADDGQALYELHGDKEGTPTMGGVLIILSIVLSSILWANPGSFYVWLCIGTIVYLGLVGFLDDYAKVRQKQSKGLSGRGKLVLQVLWAITVGAVLYMRPETKDLAATLWVPFLKNPLLIAMPFVLGVGIMIVVLVGSSNAVNLTDGLDGLAIGCTATVAFSYLVLSYVAGHREIAEYLLVPSVPGSGELAVFCGCMLGASLGFLWHNCHPAQVFMGDTGSLALGGAIGMIAIIIQQELLLVIVGGVFVMEALSVILQVISFKSTGKRMFACAPIHHHFQLKGWSETQVTIRFWILSIIFALLGVLSLKLR